jgi:hypothetical protein
MGPASITATVNVGRSADVLVQTAQVAANFNQELLSHPDQSRHQCRAYSWRLRFTLRPFGGYSISGAMSYENLF